MSYQEFFADDKSENYVVLKIEANEFFESKRLALPQRMAEYMAAVDHENIEPSDGRQIQLLKRIGDAPTQKSTAETIAQSR